MKQKKIFGGMSCLMLLGVFAMSSCVQDDMYELYDDGFESGFVRKKKSKDYGNWPDPCGINYPTTGATIPSTITPTQEMQEEWYKQWIINMVDHNPDPFPGEFVVYALYNSDEGSDKSLTQIREEVGRDMFDNEPDWQLTYYSYVKDDNEGLPTVYDENDPLHEWYEYEKDLLNRKGGVELMTRDAWNIFAEAHHLRNESLMHYRMIVMLKIPRNDGSNKYDYHFGRLRYMDRNYVYIQDQYSGASKYGKRYVQCCYRRINNNNSGSISID